MKPKKISVRPGNELEGGGIVVWIYHRKVQVQLHYPASYSVDSAIEEAVHAWQFGMENVK